MIDNNPQLREFYLRSLQKLKHVRSKDPQGSSTFQHLLKVDANGCQSLKNLFPPFIAKIFHQLQELHVMNCGTFEEIVVEDE